MPAYQLIAISAAIAVVFTQGEIFKFLRRGPWLWRELASCALCSGVWVGMAMSLLFYGFPQPGADLWTIVAVGARVLGLGALSGCAAVLFVAVWEKLDDRPAGIAIDSAKMYVYDPQIRTQRVKFVEPRPFASEEAPTEPNSSDNRLTKKVSTERLPIKESRRSDSNE